MPIKFEQRLNEGIATVEYFIHRGDLTTAEKTFVLDVGGGSTEISFVHQGKIVFTDSVKFAGNNFILSSKNLLIKVIGEDILQKEEDEILRAFNLMFSSDDFLVPGWNNKLSEFYDDVQFRSEVYFLNSIFFGSLMFYLGLHLSRINEAIDTIQVALAGNGSRFLEIITMGNQLDENTLDEKWKKFFLSLIRSGYSIQNSNNQQILKNLKLIFSRDPKKEVIFGLLYSKELVTDESNVVKKMLGLDIELNNKQIKFDEWPEENIKAINLREAKIDFSIFNKFIDIYWNNINSLTEFISRVDLDFEDVKNNLLNSLEKRGFVPLASPLFFECVFAYMKVFIKNL